MLTGSASVARSQDRNAEHASQQGRYQTGRGDNDGIGAEGRLADSICLYAFVVR